MLSNATDYMNNLLNQLAYVDIGQNWEPGDNLCNVIESTDPELAFFLRDAGFGDYVIKDYENNNTSSGFAAIAFENPETGEVGISYRGTENLPTFLTDLDNMLVGDKDAINNQIDMIDNASTAISGESAQVEEAIAFFNRNKSQTGQNVLFGHSKGGELASQVYAKYYLIISGVHVINPQPINRHGLTKDQKNAFKDEKFDAVVVDGDLVWKLGDAPYTVRIVKNNGSQSGFFGPHALQSASYGDDGNAQIEDEPFKDYIWQKIAGNVAEFAISAVQDLYAVVEYLFGKMGPVYLTRDFSDASKQKMLQLVSQVENEKMSDFTDWVGDRWYDFESWIGSLDIRCYIDNVNSYHKKVIDKNNTTEKKINEIFEAVRGVDSSYGTTFLNINQNLAEWKRYIVSLSNIVEPGRGNFNAKYISTTLNEVLHDISSANIQRIKDTMVQDVDEVPLYDVNVILSYIKKNPGEMSADEQQAVLDVIKDIQNTIAFYESASSIGDEQLGAAFLNRASWVSETNRFESFSAVSAHYNGVYMNVLDGILECGEDSNTFAASIFKLSNGERALSILGLDASADVNKLFGGLSLAAYVAKWKTEHTEQYLAKFEVSETIDGTLFGKTKIKQVGDIEDAGNEWLEDKGKRVDESITKYYDENGKEISKKEAGFYNRDYTIGEIDATARVDASLYDGKFDVGDNGNINVVVGNAEAHSGVSAGLYVIGANGEKQFMPGVTAEMGASVTAFEANWEQQWLGDENLGLNTEVGLTAGKVGGEAELQAQLFNKDGSLDVQLNAEASLEAIAGEAEGSIGVNVLGGEVEATAGVNFGIGAHAEVGFKDGVVKVDVGASLGVGVSLDVEVDVGGMVDTVVDGAEAAWDFVSDGASAAWGAVSDGWNSFWSW